MACAALAVRELPGGYDQDLHSEGCLKAVRQGEQSCEQRQVAGVEAVRTGPNSSAIRPSFTNTAHFPVRTVS